MNELEYPFVLIRPLPQATSSLNVSMTSGFNKQYDEEQLQRINQYTRPGPRDEAVVQETYDPLKTPAGWEPLLQIIDPHAEESSTYPSAAVMYTATQLTTDARRAEQIAQCLKLAQRKRDICKQAEALKCKSADPEVELKRKHDLLMKCSNLRAIENQSECVYNRDGVPTPLVPDDPGHAEEVINFSNGAQKCVEILLTKRSRNKDERAKKFALLREESQQRKEATARGDAVEPLPKRQKVTDDSGSETKSRRPRVVHESRRRDRVRPRRRGARSFDKHGTRRRTKRPAERKHALLQKLFLLLGSLRSESTIRRG